MQYQRNSVEIYAPCLGDTYQGALRPVGCVCLVVRVVDEVLRGQRRSFIAETHRYRPGRRLVDCRRHTHDGGVVTGDDRQRSESTPHRHRHITTIQTPPYQHHTDTAISSPHRHRHINTTQSPSYQHHTDTAISSPHRHRHINTTQTPPYQHHTDTARSTPHRHRHINTIQTPPYLHHTDTALSTPHRHAIPPFSSKIRFTTTRRDNKTCLITT